GIEPGLAPLLTGELGTSSSLVVAVIAASRDDNPTTLRNLLHYYHISVPPPFEADREFILLGSPQNQAKQYRLAVSIGTFGTWWMTQVDLPDHAAPQPTAAEKNLFDMLPILSTTLGTQHINTHLIHGAVAEILAEIGDIERALH